MCLLVDAYLIWKQSGRERVDDEPGVGNTLTWQIMTVDFFSKYQISQASSLDSFSTTACGMKSFQHLESTKFANESLIRLGYIGASPDKPSVAISLQTLEAYRQLHRACPRLSVQAQVKALCHLHGVSVASS
jgi:hypothetical protein